MPTSALIAIIAPASAVTLSPAARVTFAALLPGRCTSWISISAPQFRIQPASEPAQAAGLNDDAALADEARHQAFAAHDAGDQSAGELQLQFDARLVGDQMTGVHDEFAVDV